MTRLATILLLAALTKAQFAGDAAAGGTATKPKHVAPATPPAAPSAPPMDAVGRGED